MIKRKRRRYPSRNIKIKLEKVKKDFNIDEPYSFIDVDLAIAMRDNLDYRIKRRKIKKYYIQSEEELIKNKSIVAKYNKQYSNQSGKKYKEVLICMFRISKKYVQENVIYKNKMITNYYKIKFGG